MSRVMFHLPDLAKGALVAGLLGLVMSAAGASWSLVAMVAGVAAVVTACLSAGLYFRRAGLRPIPAAAVEDDTTSSDPAENDEVGGSAASPHESDAADPARRADPAPEVDAAVR
ncbi:hypothetical protein FFT09_22745 [Saccharomonospora piscinae]|uniref:hypothetical protein n=1 Tax=Saccharomonospora piscinae TaxID=687388 RepID=UPI001106FF10|nr:hypothetical protein [Saccharomonospora piscinae]TLW89248.1 hypothetical protein FFT09_22745 [Saccharomonospora piscinae]